MKQYFIEVNYTPSDLCAMERKDKMKKALLNFKPIKEVDLDALMEYYKINL